MSDARVQCGRTNSVLIVVILAKRRGRNMKESIIKTHKCRPEFPQDNANMLTRTTHTHHECRGEQRGDFHEWLIFHGRRR
jgi:hypothetical protein